jgi:DNA primase
LDPVVIAERDFLAQCLASPDAAEEMLSSIDEEAFSGEGMRRVLRYVREHLRAPEKGLAGNEGLARSVAALTARAVQLQPSRVVLQAQFLNMRIARIDAEIKERIRAGSGGVTELRRARDTLVQRRDALLQQAMEESSPED